MNAEQILKIINTLSGTILTGAGALTALLNTLGANRAVSVILAIVGVVQLVSGWAIQAVANQMAIRSQVQLQIASRNNSASIGKK